MNVSDIEINFLELFDLSYDIAHEVFGVNPIEASPTQQKKIRTWVEKTYISDETICVDRIWRSNGINYCFGKKKINSKRLCYNEN